MKKLVAGILCLVLTLSFGTFAFAAEPADSGAGLEPESYQADSEGEPVPYFLENYMVDLTTSYSDYPQAVFKNNSIFTIKLRLTNAALNDNALTFRVINEAGGIVYEGACNPGYHVVASLPGGWSEQAYAIYVKTNWSDEKNCQFSLSY